MTPEEEVYQDDLFWKFMYWNKQVMPISTDIPDCSLLFPIEFDKLNKSKDALNFLQQYQIHDSNVHFIRAIIALEDVLEVSRKFGIETSDIPPPIEGLEDLYNIMKVMDV